MLTVQILVKNNEQTIKKTLNSIESLNSKIVIGDLGCKDETLNICKKYPNIHIKNFENNSIAEIRNSLSEDLNFLINPWEVLVQGHDKLLKLNKISSVFVFQNDIISKETRLWTKERFSNPVFESIKSESLVEPSIIISSKNPPDYRVENLKKTEEWCKKRPTCLEASYYRACCNLSLRKYDKFLFYANEYLLKEKEVNTSYIMTKYYTSQIKLHSNQLKEAIENILTCISYRPYMAEFWCVLGDIYYKQQQYKKAKSLYKNAIIVGKTRKNTDKLPIEIKKYNEYPGKMIENIEEIQKNTKYFG